MICVMCLLSQSAHATRTELPFYEDSLLASLQDEPNHFLCAVHTVTLQMGGSSLYRMSLAEARARPEGHGDEGQAWGC